MNKKVVENAVARGDLKNLQDAFNQHKLEIDDSYFDYELLKLALLRGNNEIVNFLLSIGCRVTNSNNSNFEETPLHLVVKNIYHDIDELVRKLLSKGASFYKKNLAGDTPLQAAFKEANIPAVEALLNNYRSNFNPTNMDDVVHFHISCVTNKYRVVEHFLKCGFDPNKPLCLDFEEYAGLSPIQFVIKKSYFRLFFKFLKSNGDLSIKNNKGLTPLHMIYYSSRNKCLETWIGQAFQHGNQLKFYNYIDDCGLSHFHLSCILDEPDFVQIFIDNGVDINSVLSSKSITNAGFTPLHFAVKYCCETVIELLLERGADPNKPDILGESPLHLACKKLEYLTRQNLTTVPLQWPYTLPEGLMNLLEIIEVLLEKGANPNKRDIQGKTPLHWVCKVPEGIMIHKILKKLMEYNANPLIADANGCTPLHKIFYNENRKIISIFDTLISQIHWVSINYTDKYGLSLFHIVCASNDSKQIEVFLNSGVNIDSRVHSGKYRGFTALHFAVMYNQKVAVQKLLMRNALVNVKTDISEMTPLHYACEFFHSMNFHEQEFSFKNLSNQLAIIKLLILYGADVDAKNSLGLTPLLHACHADSETWSCLSTPADNDLLNEEFNSRLQEIIKILILKQVNLNAQTQDLSTLLHLMCEYKYLRISEELIKLLVFSGFDINATDIYGLTPLHLAVQNIDKLTVKNLLKYKANPNIKCKKSLTPIYLLLTKSRDANVMRHIGVTTNRGVLDEEIFLSLLESGSDVNVSGQDGKIILHFAAEHCTGYAIEKLLYYGANINVNDSYTCELLEKESSHSLYPTFTKIFQVIFIHVQKLLALGLPVSQNIKKCCTEFHSLQKKKFRRYNLNNLDNIFDNCLKELDKLRDIKIDSYTSLYDILLKNPHDLTTHVKNKSFIEIFQVRNIDNDFPLYGYLLRLQLKTGFSRTEVMDSAETALKYILNINLPDLCTYLILKYLENIDITNLKKAAHIKCNSEVT